MARIVHDRRLVSRDSRSTESIDESFGISLGRHIRHGYHFSPSGETVHHCVCIICHPTGKDFRQCRNDGRATESCRNDFMCLWTFDSEQVLHWSIFHVTVYAWPNEINGDCRSGMCDRVQTLESLKEVVTNDRGEPADVLQRILSNEDWLPDMYKWSSPSVPGTEWGFEN